MILQHWLSRGAWQSRKSSWEWDKCRPSAGQGLQCSTHGVWSWPRGEQHETTTRCWREKTETWRRRAKRKLGGTWNAGLTAPRCAFNGGER